MLRTPVRIASLVALAFAGLAVGATAPGADTTDTVTETVTLGCTGAPVDWLVPAGVTEITVEISGAAGGQGDLGVGATAVSLAAPGGLGGSTTATITTTPGETLRFTVGCVGGDSSGTDGGAGGYGGSPGGDGGDAGTGGAGGGGGGSTGVRQGGTDLAHRVVVAGGGGGSGGGGGAGGGGGVTLYPDGGFPNCLTRVVGALTCTTDCPPGFRCVGGECRLNGGDAYLQVTVRWDSFEDLDLHVIEPVADGGTCEVFYANRNSALSPSTCGAQGALDLDSEPGCPSPPDGVDIENLIYPQGATLVPGTYQVMLNHYRNCNVQLQQAAYQVEVRKGTQVTGLCGAFRRTDADFGLDLSRLVMSFTIP